MMALLLYNSPMMALFLYNSPAWWGYLKAADLYRLESLIRRAKRGGYLPKDGRSCESMTVQADKSLFLHVGINRNLDHIMRHLCNESHDTIFVQGHTE